MRKRILIIFTMLIIYALFFVPTFAMSNDELFIDGYIISNSTNKEEKVLNDLYYNYPTEIEKEKLR